MALSALYIAMLGIRVSTPLNNFLQDFQQTVLVVGMEKKTETANYTLLGFGLNVVCRG